MNLLLDTHIVLAGMNGTLDQRYPAHAKALHEHSGLSIVSSVTGWEIAIKTRLGKLSIPIFIELLPDYFKRAGYKILPVTLQHSITDLVPLPKTRDPFDRMLLSQCQVEGLKLLTADGKLVGHPLAAKV